MELFLRNSRNGIENHNEGSSVVVNDASRIGNGSEWSPSPAYTVAVKAASLNQVDKVVNVAIPEGTNRRGSNSARRNRQTVKVQRGIESKDGSVSTATTGKSTGYSYLLNSTTSKLQF